jgi:hypothetical protein
MMDRDAIVLGMLGYVYIGCRICRIIQCLTVGVPRWSTFDLSSNIQRNGMETLLIGQSSWETSFFCETVFVYSTALEVLFVEYAGSKQSAGENRRPESGWRYSTCLLEHCLSVQPMIVNAHRLVIRAVTVKDRCRQATSADVGAMRL